MPRRLRQDFDEWSEGASRDDVGRQGLQILDSGVVEGDVGFRGAGGFHEKSVFSRIRFDEVLIGGAKNGGYEARKSGAAAEVCPTPGRGWGKAKQLGRVEDVPTPNFREAVSAYEIYPLLPPSQEFHKLLEALQLLHRDPHFLAKFVRTVLALLRVAFHVKRRRGLRRRARAQALDVAQQGRNCGRRNPRDSGRGAERGGAMLC